MVSGGIRDKLTNPRGDVRDTKLPGLLQTPHEITFPTLVRLWDSYCFRTLGYMLNTRNRCATVLLRSRFLLGRDSCIAGGDIPSGEMGSGT